MKYVELSEDSKRLKESTDPCIIISSSGTADAGRVRHHISQCLNDHKNTILMSGYCSSHSLGGQLLQGAKEVEIFNQTIPVAAEVDALSGLSAHADSDDLLQFLSCQDPEKVNGIFLVHGEYDTQQAFKSRLENKGFKNILIPAKGEKVQLQNEELVLNAQ